MDDGCLVQMTLLLGPPGCGKTTLLLALAGKLSKSLKITGDVSYNGCKLDEFVPHKTSAYISQNDLHIPEMTVRDTLDFSALCLGVGSRTGGMNGSRHYCWRICCEARCSQMCTCCLGTAGCGVLLGVGMRVLVGAAGARLRIEQGGALTPQQSC